MLLVSENKNDIKHLLRVLIPQGIFFIYILHTNNVEKYINISVYAVQ